MGTQPRVQAFLTPEPARQGTQPAGYGAKAHVRVWTNGGFTDTPLYGPSTVVATKDEANAIMLPIVRAWLREKGWENAEIAALNDPDVDGRPVP